MYERDDPARLIVKDNAGERVGPMLNSAVAGVATLIVVALLASTPAAAVEDDIPRMADGKPDLRASTTSPR